MLNYRETTADGTDFNASAGHCSRVSGLRLDHAISEYCLKEDEGSFLLLGDGK